MTSPSLMTTASIGFPLSRAGFVVLSLMGNRVNRGHPLFKEGKGDGRKNGKLKEWKDGKEILPANWRGYF
jgi:hypothetical protein